MELILTDADFKSKACKVTNTTQNITKQVSLEFNMDGVTAQVIVDAAISSWTITMQRRLRESIGDFDDHASVNVDVANLGSQVREPKAAVRSSLAKLSDEERLVILREELAKLEK